MHVIIIQGIFIRIKFNNVKFYARLINKEVLKIYIIMKTFSEKCLKIYNAL